MPQDDTWWSFPEFEAVALKIWHMTPAEVEMVRPIIQGDGTFFYMDLVPVLVEVGKTQTMCTILFMTPLSPTLRAVLVQLAGPDMIEACFLQNGEQIFHEVEDDGDTLEVPVSIKPEWRQFILEQLDNALKGVNFR